MWITKQGRRRAAPDSVWENVNPTLNRVSAPSRPDHEQSAQSQQRDRAANRLRNRCNRRTGEVLVNADHARRAAADVEIPFKGRFPIARSAEATSFNVYALLLLEMLLSKSGDAAVFDAPYSDGLGLTTI